MRQQFKNLDTWRGKLTATWVCLAPPTAMVAVFVVGGVSNTFIVDAHALAAPQQDSVFDDLANKVPTEPGVDGSLPTQEKSTIQVPLTGTTDGTVQPIPGLTGDTSGIPGTVLAAYQKAANDLALAMPGCHITWPLLAGIGKVESAHASGGKVEANGNTRGKILGPVLDGGPGMAAIADTDQGVYDGNASWDRAVGPMQFIPGTWKTFGADGNGDGVKDPHNVFDAARAAGDYLCAGGANLGDPQGLVQAVLRYNHSMEYVSTVLRWMQSYSKQTVTIPDTTGTITTPTDEGNVDQQNDPTRENTTSTPTPTPTPSVVPTTAQTTTQQPSTPATSKPPSTPPPSTPPSSPTPSKPTWRPPTKPPVSTPPTNTPGTPDPTCTPTSPATPPSETPSSPATAPSESPASSPTTTPAATEPTDNPSDDPTGDPTCATPTPTKTAAN